jgi:hypothetical protein
MADNYWITYTIAHQGNADKRYQALLAAVHRMTDVLWWTEMSHFILFQSERGIEEIAGEVAHALNPAVDIAVISRQDVDEAMVIGPISDALFFELMPYARRYQGDAEPYPSEPTPA